MRVSTVILLFSGLILLFISPGLLEGDVPASERDAPIALYNSTNGDNRTDNIGWKTKKGG
jgi:hypothetical protein